MSEDALPGYSAASTELIARFEAITPERLYEHVIDLLPVRSSRVADIGAGTGRDAAWLAAKGHDVTAVEPVEELRNAGMELHPDQRIHWLDDRLPDLALLPRDRPFDVVLGTAVWQHVSHHDRGPAMQSLARLTAPGGLLVLSLRHGAGARDRPVFPVRSDDVVDLARQNGFLTERSREAASIQAGNRAAGVSWTWLALRRS